MENLEALRAEWSRLLATRPTGERNPEFLEALAQHDAAKRAFLTNLPFDVRQAVLGLNSPAASPSSRPPPPPPDAGVRTPPPPSRQRQLSPAARHRPASPSPRGQQRNNVNPPPPQSYGAWIFSGVQVVAQSVVPAVKNATAVIAPMASRTAQVAVGASSRAYSSLPPILPPVVKANLIGAVSGAASTVSQATATAVQVGKEAAAHPEVPFAYIRGALLHNFGPQPEIPPAYAINLPVNSSSSRQAGPPPPPPSYKNVDPSLLRADPPPEAAAQEGKEVRELGREELLEFLKANHESMLQVEQQTQGVAVEERIRRIGEFSAKNMAERGITERMLAQAFAKYEADEHVREVAMKSAQHEERLMAEVEVPAWLTTAKLLEIMKDLKDANNEIFPQIVRAEMAGNMPPELMQKCLEINNRCYEKHGVTEMQLQTAMVKHQADPNFASQLAAQQAEAQSRAQALVAQIQAGQA